MSLSITGGVLLAFAIGIGLGYFVRELLVAKKKSSAEAKVRQLLEGSRQEAKELLLDAKSKAVRVLEEAKREEKERERETKKAEERLRERETFLDKKLVGFDER